MNTILLHLPITISIYFMSVELIWERILNWEDCKNSHSSSEDGPPVVQVWVSGQLGGWVGRCLAGRLRALSIDKEIVTFKEMFKTVDLLFLFHQYSIKDTAKE